MNQLWMTTIGRLGRRLSKFFIAITLLAVTVVLVAIGFAATEAGSRLLVVYALEKYNEVIPGEVVMGRMSGTILWGPSFSDVEVLDRDRAPIIETADISVRFDTTSFLSGGIRADSLLIKGSRVYLRSYQGESAFSDLVPFDQTDKEVFLDETTDAPGAPRLPFLLEIESLTIIDSKVLDVGRTEIVEMVAIDHLELRGSWQDGSASVHMADTWGEVSIADISVYNLFLDATMERGTTIELNQAQIVTSDGTATLSNGIFDIIAVSGEIDLDVQTKTSRIKGIQSLYADDLPASLKARISLNDGIDASLIGEIEVASALVEFKLTSDLSSNFQTEMDFSLNELSLEKTSLPVTGRVGGDGVFSFHFDSENQPIIEAMFDCTECSVDHLGAVDLLFEGGFTGRTGFGTISAQSIGLALNADFNIRDHTELTLHWKVKKHGFSSQLPKHAIGNITGDGVCTGNVAAPTCTFNFEGSQIQTSNVQVDAIEAHGNLAMDGLGYTIQGDAVVQSVTVAKTSIKTASLSFKKQSGDIGFLLTAVDHSERQAELQGSLRLDGKTDIRIDSLESRLEGISIRLLAPMRVVIDDAGFRLGENGARISIGDGEIGIQGSILSHYRQNLLFEVRQIDLGMINQLVDRPLLNGIVDAKLQMTGQGERPVIDAILVAENLSIDGWPNSTLKVSGRYKGGKMKTAFSMTRGEHSFVDINASVPISLNLASQRFQWSKSGKHHIKWHVQGMESADMAPLLSPVSGLDFSLNSAGEMLYEKRAIIASGGVKGIVKHSRLGEVPLEANFQFQPENQTIQFAATFSEDRSVNANITSRVSLASLLDGVVEVGNSNLFLSFEDATLLISGTYSKRAGPEITAEADNIDLGLLSKYLKGFPMEGKIGANIRVSQANEKLACSIDATGRTLSLLGVALDDLFLTIDWRNRRLNADLMVIKEGREAVRIAGVMPVEINMATLRPKWLMEGPHAISWDVKDFQANRLHPDPRFPKNLNFRLSSSGSFDGYLDKFDGAATAKLLFSHGSLKDVPITASLTARGRSQQWRVDVDKLSDGPTGIRLDTKASLLALANGKADLGDINMSAEFRVREMDLSLLNIFRMASVSDIAGKATMDLSFRGTLSKPSFDGQITVRDGSASIASLSNPLSDIAIEARFDRNHLSLKHFGARSGHGAAALAAEIELLGKRHLVSQIAFKARNFSVGLVGLPRFIIDTDAEATLEYRDAYANVGLFLGDTVIKHVALARTAKRRIPSNKNVKILTQQKDEKRKKKHRQLPNIRFFLSTKKPLRISASMLETYWKAKFQINSDDKGIKSKGGATLMRGSFDLFGSPFKVEKADASFDSKTGFEPFINLSASSVLSDAIVTLKLHGNLSSPKMTLTSDPPLSQESILELLMTGTSDPDSKAAGLMGTMIQLKYPVIRNFFYNKLGLSRVSIGKNATGRTTIKLGKRVDEKSNFTTVFNMNARDGENTSEIRFERVVSPRVSVDTTAGKENSSVDLFWSVPLKKKKVNRHR